MLFMIPDPKYHYEISFNSDIIFQCYLYEMENMVVYKIYINGICPGVSFFYYFFSPLI